MPLDYDRLIFLDAEDLAECGIGEAYRELLPALRTYLPQPAEIEELDDPDAPSYSVRCLGREYVIYSPDLPDPGAASWGRAAWAFFDIVNRQMKDCPIRLFAVNGDNDLGGLFLTSDQAIAARAELARPRDWPYLPTDEPPWFGMFH